MKYDEALRAWCCSKLNEKLTAPETLDPDSVYVLFEVEDGYGCRCSSYASGHVTIQGRTQGGSWDRWVGMDIDKDNFDFERFLKEVVEAANGAVTLD